MVYLAALIVGFLVGFVYGRLSFPMCSYCDNFDWSCFRLRWDCFRWHLRSLRKRR